MVDIMVAVGFIYALVFEPPTTYLFWGVVGFLFALWFVLKYYKPSPEQFEIEKFSEVVNRDLTKSLDVLGVRTKNAKLLKGLVKIGDIAKMRHDKGIITKTYVVDPSVQKKTAEGRMMSIAQNQEVKKVVQEVPYDMHVFEVNVGDSFINIFGKGDERFVIDSNLIHYDPVRNLYQINENANLVRYGDVWITSSTGKDFVTDIAWKRGLENQVEETMNLAKKTTYLEMRHSKKIDTVEKASELEQAKYKQYKTQALLQEED